MINSLFETSVIPVVITYLLFLAALFLHNSGHKLATKNLCELGDTQLINFDIIGTFLMPFVLILSGLPASGFHNIKDNSTNKINYGGIVMNFMIFNICLFLLTILKSIFSSNIGSIGYIYNIIEYFALVNITMAVINLLPLLPLDTGIIGLKFHNKIITLKFAGYFIILFLLYTNAIQLIVLKTMYFYKSLLNIKDYILLPFNFLFALICMFYFKKYNKIELTNYDAIDNGELINDNSYKSENYINAKIIIDKIKNNQILNDNEMTFFVSMKKQNIKGNLCLPEDFSIYETQCKSCTNFDKCLSRLFSSIDFRNIDKNKKIT